MLILLLEQYVYVVHRIMRWSVKSSHQNPEKKCLFNGSILVLCRTNGKKPAPVSVFSSSQNNSTFSILLEMSWLE